MRWPGWFARRIDPAGVRAAIERAERRTSGEIVVAISPPFFGRVDPAAERAFVRLGVARTRERNGVLLFVVPSRRQLVVLGDTGIHARVGQPFWDTLVADLVERFAADDPQGGLLAAIAALGEALSTHFPHGPTDRNELPDTPR